MENRKKEEGYLLVIVALVITVFLGFVALSVDAGMLYSSRTAAQRAADAAALAGAFTFVTRPNLTDTPANQSIIKQYAIAAAGQNKIFGTSVVITEPDVDVDFANHRVTVRVNRTQDTFFARVLGSNSTNIFATAIAEAADSATGDKCSTPWFIPNTVLSDKPVCGTGSACESTPKELLVDPANPNTMTQFASDWFAAQDALPSTDNPRRFRIKPGNPANSAAPGQFYACRLVDSQGGSDYRNNISACTAQTLSCGTGTYETEPGNMIGPTNQGVCMLICYDGNQQCNNCQKDSYVSPGVYRRPDNTITTTSRSLRTAPIIDMCQYCPDNFPTGISSMTIVGFAQIFLEDTQGNDVFARLIDVTGCSGVAGGIDLNETGPLGLPLRLVRLPPSP